MVDTHGALLGHFIPKKLNSKHLPFYNESNILPCVVGFSEQEAKDLFDARLAAQVHQMREQIALIERMLVEPIQPAVSDAGITDEDALGEQDDHA